MTDVRALLDAYAATYPGIVSTLPAPIASDRREAAAPRAFTALRAVLDLHKPEDVDPDYEPGKAFCCTGCMDAYGEYREYPCATVRAITTALEAK